MQYNPICQALMETFYFLSSCLDRTRPDGDERLSDWRSALVSTLNSFLTVLFFVVLFVILLPQSTSSYLQHVCVVFFS